MDVAIKLAECIDSLSEEDISAKAIDNAKTVILDTVGCIIAGHDHQAVKSILETPGLSSPGVCSLPGRPERLDPLCAALVNGTAAHALDFDDVNTAIGGHPSAPVLPALTALGEIMKSSGEEILMAFITGFETETHLARSVNFHHYEKGWHPTATLGVFGAAAASAKLLKLSTEQTAMALALAVSLASGVKANFGTMTKPLHVGHSARNGLMSAMLAQKGFTASSDAFEHQQGFFNVFNGKGSYFPEKVTENWGNPLEIVEPGIGIKLHPCCDSTHTSIDSVLTMKAEHNIDIKDIKRIDTWIHPLRLIHVDRTELRTPTDAKFSVQFCIAKALIDEVLTLKSFEEASFSDPRVRDLMRCVHTHKHPSPEDAVEGNYLTDLRILMKSGEEYTMHMDRPFGRGNAEQATPEMVKQKFVMNVSNVLADKDIIALYEKMMDFDNIKDINELSRLWSPAASRQRAG